MISQVERARQAGYSDDEISDFLSKNKSEMGSKFKRAKESGYSSKEILDYLEESKKPSKIRSLISSPIKGILKGAQGINPLDFGPISPRMGQNVSEQLLPTREDHAEQILERAGRLAPSVALGPEGIVSKGLQLAAGTLGGELAKQNDLGQTGQAISEAVAIGVSGLLKSGLTKASQFAKGPVEKMASGLTKVRAVEGKLPKAATISSERQKQTIQKLNEEAAELTRKSIEKHVPISKQIQEEFDFGTKWKNEFGQIQEMASKANPDIDITPVSKLMSETSKKYRGIPNLHKEARNVVSEIRSFRNRPQTSLKNLLKIYRSNNQKKASVYETAHLTGKQKEYVDFLDAYNRSIAQSFKSSLPADSAWMKSFETANRDFRNFISAEKTMNNLREVFHGNPTLKSFDRLVKDVRAQKKLSLAMGKEGAQEIIQIAQDLKKSRDAIKNIPRKDWGKWDAAFPLGIFIPFIGKPLGLFKAAQLGRAAYGWLLTTSSRRAAMDKALKAIQKNDLDAYRKATTVLVNELNQSTKEDSNL